MSVEEIDFIGIESGIKEIVNLLGEMNEKLDHLWEIKFELEHMHKTLNTIDKQTHDIFLELKFK